MKSADRSNRASLPKAGTKGGRPPYPLETMLSIHLQQQWYALITDRIPDKTAILDFWHLLEENDLSRQIFKAVKANLKANGMAMK